MSNDELDYSKAFDFPVENMDQNDYITTRVDNEKINRTDTKKAFRKILEFMYLTDYKDPLSRSTVKTHLDRLSPVEQIMANKLSWRSSGSKAKFQYGMPAVQRFKDAKYRCEIEGCNIKDVRCLEIDHMNGRRKNKEEEGINPYCISDFKILCSNHHSIKTIMERKEEEEDK